MTERKQIDKKVFLFRHGMCYYKEKLFGLKKNSAIFWCVMDITVSFDMWQSTIASLIDTCSFQSPCSITWHVEMECFNWRK